MAGDGGWRSRGRHQRHGGHHHEETGTSLWRVVDIIMKKLVRRSSVSWTSSWRNWCVALACRGHHHEETGTLACTSGSNFYCPPYKRSFGIMVRPIGAVTKLLLIASGHGQWFPGVTGRFRGGSSSRHTAAAMSRTLLTRRRSKQLIAIHNCTVLTSLPLPVLSLIATV